jgi:hypothetical protein
LVEMSFTRDPRVPALWEDEEMDVDTHFSTLMYEQREVQPQNPMIAGIAGAGGRLNGPSIIGSVAAGPAVFDESDAGSGAFEPTIRSGVVNLLQHHMNEATRILPDPRDILRSWNRNLRNTIQHQSATNLSFLKKDMETVPSVDQHAIFLKSIDTPGFLTSQRWLSSNIQEVVDKDEVLEDLSGVIGIPIKDLQNKLKETLHVYQATVAEMFSVHNTLQRGLEETDQFTKKLLAIPMTDTASPEADALRQSILAYATKQYKMLGIEESYTLFCTLYTKYQALRSVLLLCQTSDSAPPTCTICMTESVNMALVPCGHTFCSPCGGKQRAQCYICRVSIRDRQRLYFL